jgi:hypothetical protein
LVGGGIAVNAYLESSFGIGLLDILNAILTSGSTLQDAPSLEDVRAQIGITQYNDLLSQKQLLDEVFSSVDVNSINNNTEATNLLKSAFGEEYNVYMFSIQTIGNLSFKVFEWSIKFTNGSITVFETGQTLESYNINVQFSNSAAADIVSGNVTTDKFADWFKDGLVKINPIFELTRFINVLPQIISTIQSNIQTASN